MLTTLKNAFKIKEIRSKILFTFAMLVVIRITTSMAKVNKILLLISLILNAFFSVVSITSPLLFHREPQSSPWRMR